MRGTWGCNERGRPLPGDRAGWRGRPWTTCAPRGAGRPWWTSRLRCGAGSSGWAVPGRPRLPGRASGELPLGGRRLLSGGGRTDGAGARQGQRRKPGNTGYTFEPCAASDGVPPSPWGSRGSWTAWPAWGAGQGGRGGLAGPRCLRRPVCLRWQVGPRPRRDSGVRCALGPRCAPGVWWARRRRRGRWRRRRCRRRPTARRSSAWPRTARPEAPPGVWRLPAPGAGGGGAGADSRAAVVERRPHRLPRRLADLVAALERLPRRLVAAAPVRDDPQLPG
ncbi:hypothetical protein SFUMM280S_05856 [Streptomyces fumanus]